MWSADWRADFIGYIASSANVDFCVMKGTMLWWQWYALPRRPVLNKYYAVLLTLVTVPRIAVISGCFSSRQVWRIVRFAAPRHWQCWCCRYFTSSVIASKPVTSRLPCDQMCQSPKHLLIKPQTLRPKALNPKPETRTSLPETEPPSRASVRPTSQPVLKGFRRRPYSKPL